MAGIGIPDEGDSVDELLPRALEPRVLMLFGRHVESGLRVLRLC